MSTPPVPVQPLTSKSSQDDGDPSWMIPVILGGSVGFLLLIVIIVLYCRWKKGAPSKKIQPTSAQQHRRITNASDPVNGRDVHNVPSLPSTSVAIDDTRDSQRPPLRRLPVRENSMRKKVAAISQTTRTNAAFIEESDDEEHIMTNSRQPHKVHVTNNREIELPRKTVPPLLPRGPPYIPSVQEESDDESEISDEESVCTTKDSVFTANTEQHSAAALPTIAVMTETQPPRHQPPVRFRTSVHPEPSLPPIALNPTSLIGRVVEEEGPIQQQMKSKADIERWRNKQRQRDKKLNDSPRKHDQKSSVTEKKAWSRAQQQIGSVLDPEAMQPIVRKKKRNPRRKYNMKGETSDDDDNVKLRGFHKLSSPREEKEVAQNEPETGSDSDISMGEAQRRIMSLLDDAFSSIKPKKHPESPEKPSPPPHVTSIYRPPLYPRPVTLPEPPPAHGRASAPSARHRRRMLDTQSTFPYPSGYYPGLSGRFNSPGYPPQPPVITKNPVVVWDPADKQRLLNQSSYRPFPGNPYTYTEPSGKLHFTPVQRTPDGMGGLVWSPYATEYAMEDFYRNVAMQQGTLSEDMVPPMHQEPTITDETVVNMGVPMTGDYMTAVPRTGESGEPLVRAIKDELFRLSNGQHPVQHV